MLKLERPLVCFDLETTGVDPVLDRIVEFGAVVLEPDGSTRTFSQRFNPGIPIPPEVTEIHGISDQDVKDCPPFRDLARKIWVGFRNRDILGYNVRRLDLCILDEELRRCGYRLEMDGVRVIDAFSIFQKKCPRDLTAAVREFCNREPTDAHGADGDAADTLDVLRGQLARFEDLGAMSIDELTRFCRYDEETEPVDLAGKLYRKNGEVYYGFGKARDKRVLDDMGFGYWMLRQSDPGFPAGTCEELRKILP